MTKQLYEEALADVKKVKQVAEDNAKRAILDAVTPRIRDFIDQAILAEHGDGDGDSDDGMIPPRAPSPPLGAGAAPAAPGAVAPGGELMVDLVAADPNARVPVDAAGSAAAITPPDAEGKVTLDIDALCSTEPGAPVPPPMFGEPAPKPEEAEYEISLESIDALQPLANAAKKPALSSKDIVGRINKINERVSLFGKASKAVRSTPAFSEQIVKMICRVEDMYDYVQEQVADPAKKSSYETMLEASFKDLNKLQESTTMSQNRKQGQMNEADVTLKLTGLPDDIDLDTVGVDLITGEEEGEEGAEGGDAGMGDLDLGGQQGGQGQEQEQQMETRRLSDDTIVEIDEKMLRREIARMRNIREDHTGTGGSETKAQSWGNGPDHFDSFGGGKDDGEPTDAEIVDKSPAPGALPLGEADEDLDEQQQDMDEAQDQDDLDEQQDQDDLDEMSMPPAPAAMDQGYGMDELDQLDQMGNRSKKSMYGDEVADGHETETWDKRRHEGLKRLGFEKKLQERAKARASALKKEAAAAKAKKNAKRFAEVKKEYQVVAQRFNESVARTKKVQQIVAQATKKLQEARSNSGTARPAETEAVDSLRKKLAETNLFNAKLLYTNKLLQNEQLTARQKAQVIKQLDTAKTVREAKLVFDSLSNTLAGSAPKAVNESRDRQVLGSGSRATRPASTQQTLNEGYEAERWAQLAGITKR
jgi:hypothetical protein